MAARATGLSKSTIHRAVKAGRVSAGRSDTGDYAIDPAELHRVFPPVQDATPSGSGSVIRDGTPSERGEVALRHARLEAEIDASLKVAAVLSEQLHEARIDRDRWREQAQQLVASPAAPMTKTKSPRLNFAVRLFGRATDYPTRAKFRLQWLRVRFSGDAAHSQSSANRAPKVGWANGQDC
jgi:hypothetical protein